MRIILSVFLVFAATTAFAKTATTRLDRTPVRTQPSALSATISELPLGATVEVVSQKGTFSQIQYKEAGAMATGFVPSLALDMRTNNATEQVMNEQTSQTISNEEAAKIAAEGVSIGADANAGLPDEVTSATTMNSVRPDNNNANGAMAAPPHAATARSQSLSQVPAQALAPTRLPRKATMAPAAVTAPRSALSTGAVAEEIAQPLNAMTLEAMRIPKAELGPESAFMRDGQLKSKILK